uniref:Uncharacterized protein AlNc14C104G6162 n=1 Tax=Albugo laibachii Nc14 TaxID=890382 RepID=F0WHV5_9STRA|nr:conserved hypothetical protein [Albugo laibachii Nc14]|eukprot:CCA20830.1 conserved hypothetical protein [Albugo laibachii Nc14]
MATSNAIATHFIPKKLVWFRLTSIFIWSAVTINGHGYMGYLQESKYRELCVFYPGVDITGYSALINGTRMCPGVQLGTDSPTNVKNFDGCMTKDYNYKSLVDFITENQEPLPNATPLYGFSLPDKMEPVVLNKSLIFVQGIGHHGPCCIRCDDEIVSYKLNCALSYTTKPAYIPLDYEKCVNAKMVWFYWVAMHGPSWQVYISAFPAVTGSMPAGAVEGANDSDAGPVGTAFSGGGSGNSSASGSGTKGKTTGSPQGSNGYGDQTEAKGTPTAGQVTPAAGQPHGDGGKGNDATPTKESNSNAYGAQSKTGNNDGAQKQDDPSKPSNPEAPGKPGGNGDAKNDDKKAENSTDGGYGDPSKTNNNGGGQKESSPPKVETQATPKAAGSTNGNGDNGTDDNASKSAKCTLRKKDPNW